MQTGITTKTHRRSFDVAPRVHTGDAVVVLRHDDEFPGWFFGRAGETEGYFPVAWFDAGPDGSTATARRDYDAAELTIAAGVPVECLESEGDWLLVRTGDGLQGWIPAECVAPTR